MRDASTGAVREIMADLAAVLDEAGDDILSREKEIHVVMADLLALPGLDTVPAGESSITDDGQDVRTASLYYDGDLRVTRGRLPAGFVQRPHNHGNWNIFGLYRGVVHYRSYRRLDDRSRPYVADLEVAEDRVMTEGDIAVLPEPPNDIHTNAALAPTTVTLLVARGEFSAVREQYLPDLGAYYEVDAARAAV